MTRNRRGQARRNRIAAIRKRDGDRCCICGLDGMLFSDRHPRNHPRLATIEHKRPQMFGGSNDLANLGLAHQRCNTARGNLTLLELRWSEMVGEARSKRIRARYRAMMCWVMPAWPALEDQWW